MVIAATASSPDMGIEMNWIWDNILPELSESAKPEDPIIQKEFAMKLSTLELKHPVWNQHLRLG